MNSKTQLCIKCKKKYKILVKETCAYCDYDKWEKHWIKVFSVKK